MFLTVFFFFRAHRFTGMGNGIAFTHYAPSIGNMLNLYHCKTLETGWLWG